MKKYIATNNKYEPVRVNFLKSSNFFNRENIIITIIVPIETGN